MKLAALRELRQKRCGRGEETGKWRPPNPVPGEGEGRLRRATREAPPPPKRPAPRSRGPSGGECPLPRPAGAKGAAATRKGFPIPHPRKGKWRRETEGGENVYTIKPPLADPSRKHLENRHGGGPVSRRSPTEAAGRLPLRRHRPRHALSKNSLISNPLPPSRTQSLQPEFPQPSEMREISADEHEPDSSWRCSESCCCSRNTANCTSTRHPAQPLLPLQPLPPLF
ncbi:hypothetical protein GW7_01106 [Heterocephalus glaber]|uniref:Uncharacterized protein n=1 Tax=Heterocephalus glaber TaxID=10181 RepID=G5BD44_HETGA|nr:hypothetical protein GW7_01106 [Heterocephalus glaber]